MTVAAGLGGLLAGGRWIGKVLVRCVRGPRVCERWEGLGVTVEELREGTQVMVPVGQIAAIIEGQPCLIALATVMGPAGDGESEHFSDRHKAAGMWWLNVHMGPGVSLPQMYRADQILGIPVLGLEMPAAADGSVSTTS